MVVSLDLRWSWQGHDVTIGLDEAGRGPTVLLLPALSSISTRGEMRPLMERLAGDGSEPDLGPVAGGDRQRHPRADRL